MEESSRDTDSNSELEDLDHFDPYLLDGSPHPSDEDDVEPPPYIESEDEEELDGTAFANPFQDRLQHTLDYWCSCDLNCAVMGIEQECVCCNESHMITRLIGDGLKCVTLTGQFKELVLSADGLKYARFLYSLTIEDEEKRKRYLAADLSKPAKMRYLAYKAFINLLTSSDFDRNVRYVLPSCVVMAIRKQFPNPEGEPYKGFLTLNSNESVTLP